MTFLTGFIYIALVIEIPERLQIVHGETSLMAGIHLLPMLGACAFGSIFSGAMSRKRNLTCPTLILGTILQVLGLSLLYGLNSQNPSTEKHYILGSTAIYGFGIWLCFAACTMIAGIEARNDDLATAQGAVAQARIFGGALGLAACTIIFNHYFQRELDRGLLDTFSADTITAIHRSPIAITTLGGQKVMVIPAYLEAFTTELFTMLIVAVVALILSLLTYRREPAPIFEAMVGHQKEFSVGVGSSHGGVDDTELENAGSIRSLLQ